MRCFLLPCWKVSFVGTHVGRRHVTRLQSYMWHVFCDTREASTDTNAMHEEMDRVRVVARARAKAAASGTVAAVRAKAAAPAKARAPRAVARHE